MRNETEPISAKDIFARAIELPSDARVAFVREQCACDEALRSRVEALLANHDDDSGFLEDPVLEVDLAEVAKWSHPDELLIGERINGWTIDRVIASGGMGTVYQARGKNEDDTVAIKLMRAGVASENAMRRFRFEAEILSRLQHEGIAKVYESGTHDDGTGGVPFFVMEYVADAQPITEYAEAKSLDIRGRVELFARVCDAVHHGHQKGVIHRDLKPANILVGSSGRAKIIDFGVARATDSDLAVTTIATSAGDLLGTLQYMSPEQCGTDPSAVDVRSDIYSLGVVLHELICGEVPYDVREVGVLEAARRIREAKPPNPREIKPDVPADLATIILKALEKEPERRYQSAAGLAADLRRYLNDEPITARPPSAIYQMRKFARRNKGLVAGGVLALLALLSATVVSILFAVRESEARESLELKSAGLEAVNEFYAGLFNSATPNESLGREVTVREALDGAAGAIAERFDEHPLVEAEIRNAVALAYLHLGRHAPALIHVERAYELRCEHLGADNVDTLNSLETLGVALRLAGRYSASAEALREVVAAHSVARGDTHSETVNARNNYVLALAYGPNQEDAIPLAEYALECAMQLPDGDPDRLTDQQIAMNNLAILYINTGRLADAADIYDSLLDAMGGNEDTLGPDVDADGVISVLNNYSSCLQRLGRYDEALEFSLRGLTFSNQVYEPDHPMLLSQMNNHGVLLRSIQRYEEAEAFGRAALDQSIEALGDDHPRTLLYMLNLGVLLMNELGRPEEAEPYLRDALERWEAKVGPEGLETLHPREELAVNCQTRGELEEAAALHTYNIEVALRTPDADRTATLRYYTRLAAVHRDMGQYEAANASLHEALPGLREVHGNDHNLARETIFNLGFQYFMLGEHEEAIPYLQEALEADRLVVGTDHEQTIMDFIYLANALRNVGRHEEAEPNYRLGVEAAARTFPPDHPWHGVFRSTWGDCLVTLERYVEAEQLLLEGHEQTSSVFGEDHERTRQAVQRLVTLYESWGQTRRDRQVARPSRTGRRPIVIHRGRRGRADSGAAGVNRHSTAISTQSSQDSKVKARKGTKTMCLIDISISPAPPT